MDEEEVSADRRRLGALVRRIRRTADLSQRELARALGLSTGAVAQAETGRRDMPVTVLARAAELAGLRLGLLDADGREVVGMAPGAVRDRVGRRFPAHLDVRYGDEDWWHGDERYSRRRPWYTFDRSRPYRDQFRGVVGTPPDHQLPQPGDGPDDRARARRLASLDRQIARQAADNAEQRPLGFPDLFTPACTCPAACELLLFAEEPLTALQRAVPHVDECPCRCDIG